jgi:transposase
MSLRPTPYRDVPAATAAVARAAFPHGSPCLRLRDHLGMIFSDA